MGQLRKLAFAMLLGCLTAPLPVGALFQHQRGRLGWDCSRMKTSADRISPVVRPSGPSSLLKPKCLSPHQ
jgi:hypothetical protein